MKLKLGMLAALAGAAALAVGLTIAPAASAAPPANDPITVPATCTDPTSGDPVSCTLQLVGFTGQNGTVQAVLDLTNNVTGQTTQILADLTAATQQRAGSCTLLDLTIQPIDLFLLGLHLHTDTIHLFLEAQRGTLLGNLLCGLFFGNPTGAATTLSRLLNQGLITL